MRNLVSITVVGALLALVIACGGASSTAIANAKQARFQGDKLELFAGAKAATEAKYKLAKSDETTLGLQTAARWYSPEGLGVSATREDVRDLVDGSLNVVLVVELLQEGGDKWVVSVRPVIFRFNKGQPKPDAVQPNDPSLPGWVRGKVDQLHYAIYEKLKPFEVRTTGGVMPANTSAPSDTPPTSGAPGAGSAP
ncbi:MAG TPA: hypothetical protein VK427_22215 [Kofleriaceae bacterium]|nr:hypothetical protein [Kofleriaceae bacterium]